jgi:hypothetical protein
LLPVVANVRAHAFCPTDLLTLGHSRLAARALRLQLALGEAAAGVLPLPEPLLAAARTLLLLEGPPGDGEGPAAGDDAEPGAAGAGRGWREAWRVRRAGTVGPDAATAVAPRAVGAGAAAVGIGLAPRVVRGGGGGGAAPLPTLALTFIDNSAFVRRGGDRARARARLAGGAADGAGLWLALRGDALGCEEVWLAFEDRVRARPRPCRARHAFECV